MTLIAIFVGAAVLVIALLDNGRGQLVEPGDVYMVRPRRRKRRTCLPVVMFLLGSFATLGLMIALTL